MNVMEVTAEDLQRMYDLPDAPEPQPVTPPPPPPPTVRTAVGADDPDEPIMLNVAHGVNLNDDTAVVTLTVAGRTVSLTAAAARELGAQILTAAGAAVTAAQLAADHRRTGGLTDTQIGQMLGLGRDATSDQPTA